MKNHEKERFLAIRRVFGKSISFCVLFFLSLSILAELKPDLKKSNAISSFFRKPDQPYPDLAQVSSEVLNNSFAEPYFWGKGFGLAFIKRHQIIALLYRPFLNKKVFSKVWFLALIDQKNGQILVRIPIEFPKIKSDVCGARAAWETYFSEDASKSMLVSNLIYLERKPQEEDDPYEDRPDVEVIRQKESNASSFRPFLYFILHHQGIGIDLSQLPLENREKLKVFKDGLKAEFVALDLCQDQAFGKNYSLHLTPIENTEKALLFAEMKDAMTFNKAYVVSLPTFGKFAIEPKKIENKKAYYATESFGPSRTLSVKSPFIIFRYPEKGQSFSYYQMLTGELKSLESIHLPLKILNFSILENRKVLLNGIQENQILSQIWPDLNSLEDSKIDLKSVDSKIIEAEGASGLWVYQVDFNPRPFALESPFEIIFYQGNKYGFKILNRKCTVLQDWEMSFANKTSLIDAFYVKKTELSELDEDATQSYYVLYNSKGLEEKPFTYVQRVRLSLPEQKEFLTTNSQQSALFLEKQKIKNAQVKQCTLPYIRVETFNKGLND